MRLVVAALLMLAVLAACGGDRVDKTTDLVIETRASGDQPWQSVTLTCQPVGGSHPTRDDACARLVDLAVEDLAPVPDDTPCTMIYGGPQQARVRGLLHGAALDAALSRENGCEIARWDLLGPDVLPQ